MAASYDPSHPPCKALSASDRDSFGYKTMQARLPVIITKVINDVYQTYHNLPSTELDLKEKEKEAKHIISTISELRYELQHDKKFRPLRDSEDDVEEWNQTLADHFEGSSWFKAPWLFAECYLYRRVRETFALTQHFRDYDPFHEQKKTVFKSSQKAVVAIAVRLMSPSEDSTANGTEGLSSLDILVSQGPESVGTEEAFFELAQFCLWGNATDLSLLDNPDLAKVEELQKRMMTSTASSSNNSSTTSLDKQLEEQQQGKGGEETSELQKHEEKILANDLNALWAKVKGLRKGRVDFILDNAGFELYVDLMFADYLIRAGFASEVVFHAKTIPWFVSDVMPVDFQWTLDQLRYASSSSNDSAPFFDPSDPAEQKALRDLGAKWQSYVDQGVWRVTSDDFWTSCYAFYHLTSLPSAQDLFTDMKKSDLWIFKGDLNYRKLVYDCQWPTTTPFKKAIGPLGSREDVPSLVTFRTCKADVVVGLAEGVEEKMDKLANDWQVSGEYAVISFKQ
ncbi:protein-glutamate O-methyltransferase [Entomortierella parvispora]|uniref:Sugar phosphate phosphatase n=1 Tax=Entomortierella parvispora TaxID=205924 RepID=A0A9P3LS40_9FUNG|nr:protein-glutamate O-methyltransferase [Entomortierella parvispora]